MKSPLRNIYHVMIVLISIIVATPVWAGLIYNWETVSGTAAVGSIEFGDEYVLGDILGTTRTTNSFSFSFTNASGPVTNIDPLSLAKYTSMELGSVGLCVPTCSTHGVPTKASAKRGGLSMTSPNNTDTGFVLNDFLWQWTHSDGLKTKAEDQTGPSSGTGRWVTAVSVPEPSSVLLLLTGLSLLSIGRKRFLSKSSK